MPTIDPMETLEFSRWDSTARHELEEFAKRTDIKIVDIRRQKDNLVVTFRRLEFVASEASVQPSAPMNSDILENPSSL